MILWWKCFLGSLVGILYGSAQANDIFGCGTEPGNKWGMAQLYAKPAAHSLLWQLNNLFVSQKRYRNIFMNNSWTAVSAWIMQTINYTVNINSTNCIVGDIVEHSISRVKWFDLLSLFVFTEMKSFKKVFPSANCDVYWGANYWRCLFHSEQSHSVRNHDWYYEMFLKQGQQYYIRSFTLLPLFKVLFCFTSWC